MKKRSIRLKLYAAYQFFFCAILIIIGLFLLFPSGSKPSWTAADIFYGVIVAFGILRMITCTFLLLYKMWAFKFIIVQLVAFIIFEIIIYQNFLYLIDLAINIALLYWIISKDRPKFT